MSADNYYFIRKVGTRYSVTCEFMSDSEPGPADRKSTHWFDTLEAAEDYAFTEYSEYGVSVSPEVEQEERERAKAEWERSSGRRAKE